MLLFTIGFALCLLLTLLYAALVLWYAAGWKMLKPFEQEEELPVTLVSVIVPARNEENTISGIIEDLLQQNYPEDRYEVIIVDDHSTDHTAAVAKERGGDLIRVLSAAKDEKKSSVTSPVFANKKAAIEMAVGQSVGDLILTTDADCRLNRDWIATMAGAYEQCGAAMLVGPVAYFNDSSFLGRFQDLDFMSLMGIAGASVQNGIYNLCSGANLCFEKKAFEQVGGYKGNEGVPTGDDLFLLHKIGNAFKGRVRFVLNSHATVYTHSAADLYSFWQQRLRWASKSTKYEDKRVTAQLVLAWLFNLSILLNLIGGWLDPFWWRLALGQFAVKIAVDTFFQYNVARFFLKTHLLWSFLPIQMAHIVYIVILGPWSTFGTYRWKDRDFHAAGSLSD